MSYFTISELVHSSTADRLGIDNTPSVDVVGHLNELIVVLDSIRELYGSPIYVNSGYRCPALNSAVKGSRTSVHMLGYAADLSVPVGQWNRFLSVVKRWASSHVFDQILIERNSRGSRWVHVGIYSNSGAQRRQIRLMDVK